MRRFKGRRERTSRGINQEESFPERKFPRCDKQELKRDSWCSRCFLQCLGYESSLKLCFSLPWKNCWPHLCKTVVHVMHQLPPVCIPFLHQSLPLALAEELVWKLLLIVPWPCNLEFVAKSHDSIPYTFYLLGVFCEPSSISGAVENVRFSKIEASW